MESGNLPEGHDDFIELVSCPETRFLCLFSQQQLQVKMIIVVYVLYLLM